MYRLIVSRGEENKTYCSIPSIDHFLLAKWSGGSRALSSSIENVVGDVVVWCPHSVVSLMFNTFQTFVRDRIVGAPPSDHYAHDAVSNDWFTANAAADACDGVRAEPTPPHTRWHQRSRLMRSMHRTDTHQWQCQCHQERVADQCRRLAAVDRDQTAWQYVYYNKLGPSMNARRAKF